MAVQKFGRITLAVLLAGTIAFFSSCFSGKDWVCVCSDCIGDTFDEYVFNQTKKDAEAICDEIARQYSDTACVTTCRALEIK